MVIMTLHLLIFGYADIIRQSFDFLKPHGGQLQIDRLNIWCVSTYRQHP